MRDWMIRANGRRSLLPPRSAPTRGPSVRGGACALLTAAALCLLTAACAGGGNADDTRRGGFYGGISGGTAVP